MHIYDLQLDTLYTPDNLKDASKYHLLIQGSATLDKGSGIAFGSAGKVGASILHIEKGSGSKGDLAFYTKQVTEDVAPVEAMRIDEHGNVGIGTPNPGSRLTVEGLIETTEDGIKFPDGSIQTTALNVSNNGSWINPDGNVYLTNFQNEETLFIKSNYGGGFGLFNSVLVDYIPV